MSKDNIENLDELIQQYTGPGKKVIKSNVTKLTAPGENYMGLVLKVEATLKNEENKEENFSAVAKCLNFEVDEHMKKMQPEQYRKEAAFYMEILPTLQEFVDEMKVEMNFLDIFPKLYVSRCSLEENSEVADENAVLLFENLQTQGFCNVDRTVGLDLDAIKIVLKDLAAFHAVPIALKLKKPQVFLYKIKIHLHRSFLGGSGGPPPPPPPGPGKKDPEFMWLEVLEDFEEVRPYLKQFQTKVELMREKFKEMKKKKVPKEPFASIHHGDLWTNNTMQKIVDGKVVKNKLIDFQMYGYETLVDDLVFFLWTSLELSLITKEFDNLIKFYHNAFIDILNKFDCDVTVFSYENLLKEIDERSPTTFGHILFMLLPIFGKKGEAVFDVKEGPLNLKKENISMEARKRAAVLVVDFAKRGWL